MLIDALLVIADAQAITATAQSNNIIDLGAADLDLGEGTPIWLWGLLTTGFATSANTLTIDLENDGSNPPTTKVQELLAATATSALLTPATLFRTVLPITTGRYLGAQFTVSAGLTVGVVSIIATHH